MGDKRQKLERLKSRNEELKPIVFAGFNSSEELKAYIKTIQTIHDEYFENLEEINKLQWELMTPEERTRDEEIREKIRAKSSGNR